MSTYDPEGSAGPWAPEPTPPASVSPESVVPAPAPHDPPAVPRARTRRTSSVPLAAAVAAGVAAALVIAVIGGLIGGALGYLAGVTGRPEAPVALPAPAPPADEPADPEPGSEPRPAPPLTSGTIAEVVAAALPAVVSLEVGQDGVGGAAGSGFVIRDDGYILTNNHVVESAVDDGASLDVVFTDGTRVTGRVIGRNVSYDLAVVAVDRNRLPILELGDSDGLAVGDTVIAIGSPLGLAGTVTSGIVSAVDRPVTVGEGDGSSYINAVQTDAAINPGNSGGPLLDSAGRVVGVNSAIATVAEDGRAGNIGLGFAIPSRQASRIAGEIIETGSSVTPIIGVTLADADGAGALLETVEPGGPADDAGLRAGDLVVAADGRRIADTDELVVAIRDRAPGDTLVLTVERNGTAEEFSVILGSRRD